MQHYTVDFEPQVKTDLDYIARKVAGVSESIEIAENYVRTVVNKALSLRLVPYRTPIYRVGPKTKIHYHATHVKRVRIIYHVKGNTVIIDRAVFISRNSRATLPAFAA